MRFRGSLRVLFGRVIYDDIDSSKFLHRLRNSFSAELLLTDITFNQEAFTFVFLHQTLGFIRIFSFFKVDD